LQILLSRVDSEASSYGSHHDIQETSTRDLIPSPTDLEIRGCDAMDRIRSSLHSLRIHDSRHELSKNPPVLPSNWDPGKYPPVLGTDQKILGQKMSTIPPPPTIRTMFKPTDVQPENEGFHFGSDSSSSTSRASSCARSIAYSSCFSENSSAGRSSSLASSLSFIRTQWVEHDLAKEQRQIRRDGELRPRAGKRAKSVKTQVRSGLSCPQASSEIEHIPVLEACEETPRSTGTGCDSGPSHHPSIRTQWVEHDLAKEQRQIRRDGDAKRGKLRPRAGKKAKSVITQVRSGLSCPQASSEIEHIPVLEACEETPRSTGTGCDSGPSRHPDTPDILGHRVECRSATSRSNIGSQTDSTSSEDATDWEDDSDLEDTYKVLQVRQVPDLLGGRPETGHSRLQTALSPMKSRLIEKLMVDFWAIFDSRWPESMRQHGSSGRSTARTTASESATTSRDSLSVRYGKRCRSDDDENEESDDHHERRRKRAPVDKLPAVREDDQFARQFACPFRKHDPRKYSIQEWPRCAEKPQKTIARLK